MGQETDKQKQPERRSFARRRCDGSCEIFAKGTRCGWGAVTDISRGGCYIETPEILVVGSQVQLRLRIASIDCDIAAKVATSHPLVGMGMKFLPIPETEQGKLTAMLARVVERATAPLPRQPDASVGARQAMRILPGQAPRILAEIVKRINAQGVLTRQDLFDIVLANR